MRSVPVPARPVLARALPGRIGWRRLGFSAGAIGLRLLAVAVVVASPAAPARAADWVVDEAVSQIGFNYRRAGAPAPGIFHRFAGSGTFDAAHPDAARMTLRIDTASIDLHDALASAFATSAEWFDSKNFPQVVYRLVSLAPLGGGRYRTEGFLTIRGETEPITSEIELEVADDVAMAKGTLEIDRRPFLLGVGPSAAFVEIGPQVEVSFDLTAHPTR